MDTGSSSSSQLNIVIFPWLAFGHLLPCLDLAEQLASRGHRVSFVSTPRNIARLPPVRPAVAQLVEMVALPFQRVDGIPDGAESMSDVPRDKSELHLKAFDGLAEPFSEFLRAGAEGSKKPDWVIVEPFHYWAAAAAIEHKVPCAMLLLCAARMIARLPKDDDWKKMFTKKRASGMSVVERSLLTLERCNLVAIRSCLEWEPESIPLVATHGKPVVPLGLLPPSPEGRRVVGDGEDATVRWLDTQPAKSVVYVALGSELALRVEDVHELALGLELAGTGFLWAMRKPSGIRDDADVLPPGFEERTRGRGLVIMGWVPQISVLAHGAVAAFLTHCGWGSTIEGILFGRPLIMLPIVGDEGPNATLMEERKVGVEVPRHEKDGSFDREGIATAVRAVTAEEGIFTANAKKLQEIVADRECHDKCIDGFIRQLRSYKE